MVERMAGGGVDTAAAQLCLRDAFTGADLDDGTGVVLEGWGYRLLEA